MTSYIEHDNEQKKSNEEEQVKSIEAIENKIKTFPLIGNKNSRQRNGYKIHELIKGLSIQLARDENGQYHYNLIISIDAWNEIYPRLNLRTKTPITRKRIPFGPEPKTPIGPEPRTPFGPEPRTPIGPEPRTPIGPEPKQEQAKLESNRTARDNKKYKQRSESAPVTPRVINTNTSRRVHPHTIQLKSKTSHGAGEVVSASSQLFKDPQNSRETSIVTQNYRIVSSNNSLEELMPQESTDLTLEETGQKLKVSKQTREIQDHELNNLQEKLIETQQKLSEAVAIANNNSALVDSHYSRGEENRLATEESNEICEVLSNSIDAIYEIVDQAEDLETVSSIRTKIMNIEKDANAKIEAIQEKYGSGIMAIQNTSEQDSKPEEGSSFPNNSPAITDSKQVSKQNQRQIQ